MVIYKIIQAPIAGSIPKNTAGYPFTRMSCLFICEDKYEIIYLKLSDDRNIKELQKRWQPGNREKATKLFQKKRVIILTLSGKTIHKPIQTLYDLIWPQVVWNDTE